MLINMEYIMLYKINQTYKDRCQCWGGAQSEKCWARVHEDLNLDTQHTCKELVVMACMQV